MKTRVTPEGKFITDPDPAPGSMDWPACAQYYCLGIVLCALALVLALAYDRIQGHTFGTESQQWLKGQELEKERGLPRLAALRLGRLRLRRHDQHRLGPHPPPRHQHPPMTSFTLAPQWTEGILMGCSGRHC